MSKNGCFGEWVVVPPETVGIPSKAVLNFIDELEYAGLCMHGFVMVRYGKVFAEAYYAPFHADFPHRMFSISKSFTSVAIGLLQEEGKLSINDRICDYFPDKLPAGGVHPYIAKTTIRDMLRMASPHKSTTYKLMQCDDWVKTFFHVEPVRYPGTSFVYDTSASHVLAALVERLSGMSLLDYLKIKVLDKLGCTGEFRWLTDPVGVSMGGSGLICTLRDVTRFALMCMNDGAYNGQQIVPRDYIREATSKQIDTCLQYNIEERQGYGYQFWRCRNNGFAMYGMGGQLAICLPDYDFILTTIADNQGIPNGVQGIYAALWNNILPHLKENKGSIPVDKKNAEMLAERISKLEVKPVEGSKKSAKVSEINGRRYILAPNQMGISECRLEFGKDEGTLYYTNETGSHQISFGIGHMKQQIFPDINLLSITSAAWVDENTLHLRSYIIDELPGNVNMSLTFMDNTVTIAMKRIAEDALKRYEGFASGEWETV
ncbi:beta-lactamase family protein [Thermoclostridium stercorarium]|uniref:serine hydrolase domain-containing protein n=1 Tax=Thermoclostridium stercorarium TaxID=1510 RepID=UPI0004B2E069|nr:serine hydrolase [Thermoclostridium stercorarium]UZQ86079.1 beta-lactamase family protein [Thermoclostridium stercorarium]